MDEKKAFPLRMSTAVLDAIQQWANDELRSLNAQIEYVLRDALRKAHRLPKKGLDEGASRIRKKT
jgi:hypothetical protein